METDPHRWIAALRSSHDRLAALVDGFDATDLDRQSMCADWSVARVLGHLGSGAEIALANLEAHVAGVEPPGAEVNPAIWDRWNAMAPGDAAAHFVRADRSLVERFEGLDESELAGLSIRLSFLPGPIDVAGAVGFRLSEHALHSWDVFAAFDAAATIAAESTELLVDRLPMMVGFVGRFTPRDTRPAEPVTITVETAEPARRYELELGDIAALRPATTDGDTDGRLVIPAEALLRLTAGRLKPERPSADVEPDGALSLADLCRAFPGY